MTRAWPWLAAGLVLMLTVGTTGCLETSNPPPTLCELMVDLDEEHSLVWVYMQGVEHIRFDNLTLVINGSVLMEHNVFSLQRNTTDTSFDLRAEAAYQERYFHFEARLSWYLDEERSEYRLEVVEEGAEQPQVESLPYSILMDKVVMGT